jgi:phosphate transport system substrate-binding protein
MTWQRSFSALVLLTLLTPFSSIAAEITGAGSTFVYPVIARWADAYKTKTGTSVNYQSIGSGGGIKLIKDKNVDFGATDKPLKPEELKEAGLVQFPIINGAVVPVVNLEGVAPGKINLSGPVVAEIYLGKIKKWNDPAIVALNKGMKLPDQMISVVHRSDGSGTTFIWTDYLAKISPAWKEKVGSETAVQWPTGVGAKGNEGVASNVQQIKGSIGYVEYAYALQNKMTFVQMFKGKDKKGNDIFVAPNAESFAAAAKGADWAKATDYYLILTNAPGEKSWPIAGSTFILMHDKQASAEQGKAALDFFRWAYANGEASAKELHYVPIPTTVAKMVEKTWQEKIKTSDGASIVKGL